MAGAGGWFRALALKALEKEATTKDEAVSRTTLEQHFDAFLHTYVPTRGRKGIVRGQPRLSAGRARTDYEGWRPRARSIVRTA